MLLLVDSFVGWVLLPSNFMFISLLLFWLFFYLLVVFLHKVSMSIIWISNRFLYSYSALYKPGNSSSLGPSGIRKRLFWHSSPERWFSFWDAQCFLQAQPPPERLQGGRMEEILKNVFGHTWLSFDLRSVELVKTTMNSWNFQPLESPDGFKLSLKHSYFTMCVFP